MTPELATAIARLRSRGLDRHIVCDACEQQDRELSQRKGWQKCRTHGAINANHAWGCPDCVSEQRRVIRELARALKVITPHIGAHASLFIALQIEALLARPEVAAHLEPKP